MQMSEIRTSKKTSKFYATDACTACALCMELCPMRCIEPDDRSRPVWEGTCTMCLACLHRCPAGAVQYGRDTLGKGRYLNPKAGPPIGKSL
jgi:NAD-dependent dihydropyrimidine dehydrogenase PreA subunit